MRRTYHHGDLRAALVRAGEEVLAETGVAGFSLRKVARKVGVSHAAPAHHFGDAQGLLAALATEGFGRLRDAMRARQRGVSDPAERLVASGLGYIDFARACPALFRLMFGDARIANPPETLATASQAAFGHLVSDMERLRGTRCTGNMAEIYAAWSLVHGLADLVITGNMRAVTTLSQLEQDAFFRGVLARHLALEYT